MLELTRPVLSLLVGLAQFYLDRLQPPVRFSEFPGPRHHLCFHGVLGRFEMGLAVGDFEVLAPAEHAGSKQEDVFEEDPPGIDVCRWMFVD